jgi:hypothetical protein
MIWFTRKKVEPKPDPTPNVEALAATERAESAKQKAESTLVEMKEHAERSRHHRQTNHFAPAILDALSSRRNE